MPQDMKELETLLDYLIQHNKDHAREIVTLAAQTKDMGIIAVHEHLAKGIEEMNRSTDSLQRALIILRGDM